MIGLRWQDVDWNRETIRVKRAVTRAARAAKKEESTKTAKSTRDVKLLRPALDALTAQKAHTFLLNDSIFHNPRTGKAWHNDQSVRNSWNRSIHYAKVRYRRPSQTRHTYASMMLTAGESPMWVANQMGHTSVKMIEQRYGRWIEDAGGKAVAMFGGLEEKAGKNAGINRHL
jgi:integrase